MSQPFNNPDVVVQSWYVVARSADVGRGRVISGELLGRRIAIYRGDCGRVYVLEARCAHLGADLAQGQVVGDELRCAFHHWTYAGGGACVRVPTMESIPAFARVFGFPTEEKYGAIWVFNGPRPAFPIPHFDDRLEQDLVAIPLPPQELNCHPHIVAGNGLDIQHFRTVHQFEFAEEPQVEEPDCFRVRLRLTISLRGHNLFERAMRLLVGDTLAATFTTWGGNLATIDGRAGPFPVLVLFSHRPLLGGRSASQTFFFLPKQRGWKRLLGFEKLLMAVTRVIMGYILAGDRAIFDTIEFRPRLVKADVALAAFIRQVNGMEVFDCAGEDRQ